MATTDTAMTTPAAVATELAMTLDGWTVHTYDNDVYEYRASVDGPEGRGIFIRFDNYRKKIEARGEYPVRDGSSMVPSNVTQPVVSCAASRLPGAIATDIIRRLLPAYRELFAAATVRAAEHDDYQARKAAATERFLVASGGKMQEWSREKVWTPFGSCNVTPDGVRFEYLSVTLDQAIKIAELLRA